ncbi:MAG: GNAT family protein [Planctomycetota bacterium]
MTRCASEAHHTPAGLAWKPPAPLPIPIETPRLMLRAYEPSDARECFRVVDACRDSLLPWLPWARTDHLNEEASLRAILNWRAELRDTSKLAHIILGVFERETGELVGGSGFHDVRPETASCEVGYWTRPDRRGLGYAGEATAHLLSRCLLAQGDGQNDGQDTGGMGFERVRIYCSSANAASKRIPEKLGLTPEVMQRRDYHVEGVGPTDRLGWGVLSEEWDAGAHRIKKPAG